eukprot:UN17677
MCAGHGILLKLDFHDDPQVRMIDYFKHRESTNFDEQYGLDSNYTLCIVIGPESSGTKMVGGLAAIALDLQNKFRLAEYYIGDYNFNHTDNIVLHRSLPMGNAGPVVEHTKSLDKMIHYKIFDR